MIMDGYSSNVTNAVIESYLASSTEYSSYATYEEIYESGYLAEVILKMVNAGVAKANVSNEEIENYLIEKTIIYLSYSYTTYEEIYESGYLDEIIVYMLSDSDSDIDLSETKTLIEEYLKENSSEYSYTSYEELYASGYLSEVILVMLDNGIDFSSNVTYENIASYLIKVIKDDMIRDGYASGWNTYNSLTGEMSNFYSYIMGITGANSVSELEYVEYEVDDKTVYGFDLSSITLDFISVTDENGSTEEPTVSFNQEEDVDGTDSMTYKIGPFNVNSSSSNVNLDYVSLSNASLQGVINGETVDLTYGTDYHFESEDTEGIDDDGYPIPGYNFYLVVNYKENMTQISNLSFDYSLINAGGKYAVYETYQYYCDICNSLTGYGWCNEIHTHTKCSCGEYDVDEETHTHEATYVCTVSGCTETEEHTHTYCTLCGETDVSSSTHWHYACGSCKKIFSSYSLDSLHASGGDHAAYVCQVYVGDTYYEACTNKSSFRILSKSYMKENTTAIDVQTIEDCGERKNTQYLVVCEYAYMWEEKHTISWNQAVYYFGNVTVDKVVEDSSGNQVNEDGTYYFEVYVDYRDGNGYVHFQTLSVTVSEGEGSATTENIYWFEDSEVPYVRVVEVQSDGTEYTGTVYSGVDKEIKDIWQVGLQTTKISSEMTEGENIFYYVNVKDTPYEGNLNLQKVFDDYDDDSDYIDSITETFYITVTGDFKYDDTWYYTTGESLSLTVEVGAYGSYVNGEYYENSELWEWISDKFMWYGDAPYYEITEDEELAYASGYIQLYSLNTEGYLMSGETTTASIVNTSANESYLEIDKKLVSETDPENDEIFVVEVTITGNFKYDGRTYKDEMTIEIELDKDNNWQWTSEKITWLSDEAPTYTVKETNTGNYYHVSTEDITGGEVTSVGSGEILESELQEGYNYVYITNDDYSGDIKIYKTLNNGTDQNFEFQLEVTGTFIYQVVGDVNESNDILTTEENITITGYESYSYDSADDITTIVVTDGTLTFTSLYVNSADKEGWSSGTFRWTSTDEVPTYSVEEVNIPDGYEFVKIAKSASIASDDETYNETITDKQSVSGLLIDSDTVVINTTNTSGDEPESESGFIKIKKEITGVTESLDYLDDDDKTFTFEVKIKGDFTYEGSPYTSLTLNDVTIIGEDTWVSSEITWESSASAPEVTITEIGYSEYFSFVSWQNENEITNNISISGTVGETISFVAINELDVNQGWIEVSKKTLTDDLVGDTFEFTLTVTGDFIYQGNEETEKTITFDLVANGESWISDTFYWLGDDPEYSLEETEQEDITCSIINESGTLTNGVIIQIVAENDEDIEPLRGRIQIDKEYIYGGNEIEGETFYFEIKLTFYPKDEESYDITFVKEVESGSIWRSEYYYWDEEDGTPTVSIREINIASGVSCKLTDGTTTVTTNGSQSQSDWITSELTNGGIVKFSAVNENDPDEGYIKIVKYLESDDKVSESDLSGEFTFNVYLSGTFTYKGTSYANEENCLIDTVTILASGSSGSSTLTDQITWTGDSPTYLVEEVSCENGYYLKSSANTVGSLEDGLTIEVSFTNTLAKGEILYLTMDIGGTVWNDTNYEDGKISDVGSNGQIDEGEDGIAGIEVIVTRVIVSTSSISKTSTLTGDTYTDTCISGDGNILMILDGVYVGYGAGASNYSNDTYSDGITIYNCVSTETDSDGNWSLEGLSVPALTESERESKATFTSKYSTLKDAVASGDYMVTYNVTFLYDGQTYESTEYLVTSDGNSSQFIQSTTSQRDNWLLDSMAEEADESSGDMISRSDFNNMFATIVGDTNMDVSGYSTGTTLDSDGQATGITLNYSSTDVASTLNSDNTRKVSTLESYYDADGNEILMTASTSTGGLTYPFDSRISLSNEDTKIDLYPESETFGISVTEYHYSATYNYTLNINLGLVEREYTDVSIEKDLTEATVVVNGKALKYKYNSTIDLDDPDNWEDLLYKLIETDDVSYSTYSLGLYSSDYYYRASIYEDDTNLWSALEAIYGAEGGVAEALELEIYLTYTIVIYNESETYDVVVKEVADYADESLIPITEDVSAYIQTFQGEDVNNYMTLAYAPTITYNDTTSSLEWTDDSTIKGSDEVTYVKRTTDDTSNITLASGDTAEIVTTYKVNKSTDEDAIELGAKCNIAEITSFSSYYQGTNNVTGRVDKDSAPDNVNIEELNETEYYEDDTDSAPRLYIEVLPDDRTVSGLVWEDGQSESEGLEYNQVVGDGKYDAESEETIAGITTELIETIAIPVVAETDENGDVTYLEDSDGHVVYKEYDFLWATTTTDGSGEYTFSGITAGNYKVRFVYGDTYIETGNEDYEVVYNGQDYKSTTYQVGYEDETNVTTTDEDGNETTVTYEGNDSDGDGYTDNEWHDLSNDDLNSARVSDARDSEARRLVVASRSEILTYDNTSILALADEFLAELDEDGNVIDDSAYDELFGEYDSDNPIEGSGYYMYAETAKLDIEIENVYDETNYDTYVNDSGDSGIYVVDASELYSSSANSDDTTSYDIEYIDFGLEERSQTELVLDKQIQEIQLTTSDGNVILDAIYNISYELTYNGETHETSYEATVEINKEASIGTSQIASLNRSDGTQGYRYIMMESSILQGATISITYQLTVLNIGEADTCNAVLTEIWDEYNNEGTNSLYEEALLELTSPYYTVSNGRVTYSDYDEKYQYGLYFGSIYYLGTNGTYTTEEEAKNIIWTSDENDNEITYYDMGYYNILVESTIHQIIDYVDPDVEFVSTDNATTNQSWSITTISNLLNNKLIDPSAVIIIDEDNNPVLKESEDGTYTGVLTLADTYTDDDGNEVSILTYDEENETYTIHLPDDDYDYTLLSDEVQRYVSDTKHNLIISQDDSSSNPGLVKATVPYGAEEDYDDATASITLEVSKYFSSEDDSEEIDNIAEIIKVENTVGRRDIEVIVGNTITYQIDWEEVQSSSYTEKTDIITTTKDIYNIASGEESERDTSATEIITLTPPTGSNSIADYIMQILAVVGCCGVILAIGIVLIKKKVLNK